MLHMAELAEAHGGVARCSGQLPLHVCLWRLRNQKEIVALMEELSALYPAQILYEMYETAISDEDHSFWYINLVAKRKEDMFHVRFEHKMVLDM